MSGVYFLRAGRGKHVPGGTAFCDDLPEEIEKNLRLVYDTCVADDVPERFAQLLARLREQERLS